jgi:hypothetical protein
VDVRTDGPTRLVLTGLPGPDRVHDLAAGRTRLRVGC